MAGSIKDAFSKAKIQAETFKKKQETLYLPKTKPGGNGGNIAEQEPIQGEDFAAEMARQGIQSSLQAENNPRDAIHEANNGRSSSRTGLYVKASSVRLNECANR